jgi:hypothetical protein
MQKPTYISGLEGEKNKNKYFCSSHHTVGALMTLTLTILQRVKLDSAIAAKQDVPKNMLTIWSLASKIALTPHEESMYLKKLPATPMNPSGLTVIEETALLSPNVTPIELESAEARALDDILKTIQVTSQDRHWLPAVMKQLKDSE